MKAFKRETTYEAPQVEIIEVEVEKGFAVSGPEDDGDPTIDIPGMGWG